MKFSDIAKHLIKSGDISLREFIREKQIEAMGLSMDIRELEKKYADNNGVLSDDELWKWRLKESIGEDILIVSEKVIRERGSADFDKRWDEFEKKVERERIRRATEDSKGSIASQKSIDYTNHICRYCNKRLVVEKQYGYKQIKCINYPKCGGKIDLV